MTGRAGRLLLCAEAALCLVLGLTSDTAWNAVELLKFPFEHLGRGLRALSLSGGAGNVCALALYGLFCLLPAALLLGIALKRRFQPEDTLLGAMAALLFFQMYYMINPSLLPGVLGPVSGTMGGILLGGVFYSLLAAWLLLRFLRACLAADGEQLARCCRAVLGVTAAALVLAAFGLGPARLKTGLAGLAAANSGSGGLGLSRAVLVLGWIKDAAVCLLDLWVLSAAAALLGSWSASPYRQETVQAADRLSRRGAATLSAAVLLGLGFQLLQLLLIRDLRSVSMDVEIPVFSVALVLAALLLARLLREGKRLKDDNDLFV